MKGVIVANSISGQLKGTREKLRDCKRQLKAAEEVAERFTSLVEPEELAGWEPQRRIERMYGWVFAWLYPLSSYMNQNLNKPLTPDIRNKIHEIVTATIGRLAVEGKYGIKLPHDPRPVDFDAFAAKQSRILNKEYEPCAVCGEDRITHECHILPKAEGGPLHADNFIMLCPLHHHLFDHNRLTKDEWKSLESHLEEKMEAAVQYASQVRLPMHQEFWLASGDETSLK